MNLQRWAILGVQFGYPATREIGSQHGASAEVAERLQAAYRDMVNKLNLISLHNGRIFSAGLPHSLAVIPPERLQQIFMQRQQREDGQEGLLAGGGGAPGPGGAPSMSQPGMPAQPSQQLQQSRLSMPGLPVQPQQPNLASGVQNPGVTPVPGQYLTPQGNPPARPLPPGMQQPVNPGPVPSAQPDRPPSFEAPEAAVVLKMQEKAIEIFKSQMAQNANNSESTFRFHCFHFFLPLTDWVDS